MGSARVGLAVVVLAGLPAGAFAQTTFNGGELFTAGNWSNGLPTLGNNGTIAVGGTINSNSVNLGGAGTLAQSFTVSHTAGNFTLASGNDWNVFNGTSVSSGATVRWTQSSGTLTVGRLIPNYHVVYELTGTGVIAAAAPGDYVFPVNNGGVFHQTGGTVTGMGFRFNNGTGADTHRLSGGTATNVGDGSPSAALLVGTNNRVEVDGSFALTFNPSVTTSGFSITGTGGVDFQDTWTGNWTRDNFTLSDWQAMFIQTGLQVEGTRVTAGNFATFFEVTNAGAAGSNIHLNPVPEPAGLLLVVGAAAGAWRVRGRLALLVAVLLVIVAPAAVCAQVVPLQAATATFSQTSFLASATIDGNTSTGWAIATTSNVTSAQTIVWETQADAGSAGGSRFTFTLTQSNGVAFGHNIGRFRLSYTTDARSMFADGLATGGDVTANWTVIAPAAASSTGSITFATQPDNSLLVTNPSTGGSVAATYTIAGDVFAAGVTGFRLEALEDVALPTNGPGLQPTNGNFVLNEFAVSVAPVPEPAGLLLVAAGMILTRSGRVRLAATR